MSLGLFITDALAQTADVAVAAPAAGAPPGTIQEAMMRFLPWFAILGVFYFMLIRPQNKKFEAHKKMVEGLRRGDRVTSIGGVIGVISRIEGDEVVIEVEDGMKLRMLKSSVSQISAKTEPAADTLDKTETK